MDTLRVVVYTSHFPVDRETYTMPIPTELFFSNPTPILSEWCHKFVYKRLSPQTSHNQCITESTPKSCTIIAGWNLPNYLPGYTTILLKAYEDTPPQMNLPESRSLILCDPKQPPCGNICHPKSDMVETVSTHTKQYGMGNASANTWATPQNTYFATVLNSDPTPSDPYKTWGLPYLRVCPALHSVL
jgi:hypothetical protein